MAKSDLARDRLAQLVTGPGADASPRTDGVDRRPSAVKVFDLKGALLRIEEPLPKWSETNVWQRRKSKVKAARED